MLHEEYNTQLPLTKTQPLKIPYTPDNKQGATNEQKMCNSYSSSENLFDPSTSPPVSDFMKRLMERHSVYNNVANLSKFTNA
uniref:Uncharacterized protein n=1 Tax=viral metagenome TaxID=1070528 RepID=A0A6C0FCX3_9ZZZZ